MKKFSIFVLALVCILGLVGCKGIGLSSREEVTATYSFCGENNYFGISNGVVVLNEEKDIFRGGNLKIVQETLFSNVASYTATFYTMLDGEKITIQTATVNFNPDVAADIDGDNLGETSGKDFLLGNKVKCVDDLINNLWVELKVIDLDGKETVYQLQLTLTEITD